MRGARRNRFILWLSLVTVAAGCNRGPRGPRNPGDEWLKTIAVDGNRSFKDKELVNGLALRRSQKRGTPPDPYLIQVDEDRIRGQYLRHGYLGVDVRSRVERQGDATTVVYSVEEGRRARTRVVITGLPDDPALPVSRVRAALPLADGAPFDYEVYDTAKEQLKAVVEDAGYPHVVMTATVIADRANDVAVVTLDYAPGPKSTFGPIQITGVDGELREAVEERLQFRTGQPYSLTAITTTQRQLYAMNRFSTVRVQPEKNGSPVVAVTVDVAESARREIKLGGGFGMDPASYEVRARTGYSITGWPTQMDTVTFDLRPAYALLRDGSDYEPRVRALAKYQRQDLLWTYGRGEIEAAYNYIAYEAYTAYGPRAQLGYSTPVWTDRFHLRAGWGITREDFRNLHPLIDADTAMRIGIDDTAQTAAFQQSLIVDLRDHPIEPRLGAYAEVRVSEGTRYAGGDYEFVEVVPELRGFVPAGPVTLASRLRAGAVFGELSPTERLFSGGASRHRGFAERKLAPSVFGTVDDRMRSIPYGGGGLLEAGLEARIPITTIKEMPVGGVVFLDGGDVRERLLDLEPANLHWAAGVGLRIHTIVGPVRADLGYRLNRKGPAEPDPNSSFAFHLSLGEAF